MHLDLLNVLSMETPSWLPGALTSSHHNARCNHECSNFAFGHREQHQHDTGTGEDTETKWERSEADPHRMMSIHVI